jgi:hypothetical protein
VNVPVEVHRASDLFLCRPVPAKKGAGTAEEDAGGCTSQLCRVLSSLSDPGWFVLPPLRLRRRRRSSYVAFTCPTRDLNLNTRCFTQADLEKKHAEEAAKSSS